ncbi:MULTISPECIES: cupin domain-containing protein [Streptomyces]|uniref:cupin domain-containing protein n=1 Tax=Streptomyces TaxID=1883 RepID=UPI00163BF6A4|nr:MULTISPECIES: cupin domain-containing protein [Streptomyces]MBC2874275.1 cupin domain-containing protein [Streptomyces sp. TYQ1024]UBI40311.1 cupin domain-containing protein [Streptomyces mobaraensis]UKW32891.1 cupin domain-containing protein [Streptomyces sp. TYQ1024]
MRRVRGRRSAVAAVALVATAAFCLPSDAATGPAPRIVEVARGTQTGPVKVAVDGPLQVDFRTITIPPGGGTGKHCHHGQLVGVVKAGTLTHYAPLYPGGVHVYRTGDSLTEGKGYVHEGRNEGTTPLVLWATYVTPKGKPLAETDLSRCDAP